MWYMNYQKLLNLHRHHKAVIKLKLALYKKAQVTSGATFKNRQTIIKVFAAFAEDCLSLRSKRVPQVLQILAYLLHLPFIFCWSEGILG